MTEHPNQFRLLRERRFAPFFWTQFLGAANDNVFKNAFVVFVAFGAAAASSIDPGMVVNLIGAVFILPFVLLSATSGQIADKLEKSQLIRAIKLLEIVIMVVGIIGFARGSLTLLFAALALLGVHSALFGPVKYSILPQHLRTEELVGGNGLVEMGTFVAILLGTIAGGVVVAIVPHGPLYAGALAIFIAVAGWLVSRGIPMTPAVDAQLRINWNPFTETWRNLRLGRENVVVWRSMLGISWFWFYGAIYLAQLPVFTRDVLGGDEHVLRCCSPCSPSALAPARCCARSCPGARSRSASCRSARSASRCSRSTCGSPRAAWPRPARSACCRSSLSRATCGSSPT